MRTVVLSAVAAAALLVPGVALAQPAPAAGSASGGTAGSAAAGGTSASTIGLGSTSTGENGTSSSLGTGGSAAAVGGGHVGAKSKVNGNRNGLNGHSKARAQNGGTWSDSKTHIKVHKGEVRSRTKSMSHVPGQKPTKSTSTDLSGE